MSSERISNKEDSISDYEPHSSADSTIAKSTTKSIGIRKVELLTDQYKHPALRVLLFFSIFLCAYTYSLDGTVRYTLQGYATGSYGTHSRLSTVNVIRAVVAAAAQPAYARMSDKFGRIELIVVSMVFYSMGTVIQSQAYDFNRFAGGSVLYQIGYTGIMIMLQIIIADFSTLNWRLTASFVPALPFIINTWVSGNVTSSLVANYSWNWSFGMWAFIFPLSCVPLLACFFHIWLRARKTNEWAALIAEEKTHYDNYPKNTIKYYTTLLSRTFKILKDLFWELDVIGILFIICVFGLILVPFTLAGGSSDSWKKASTIAPLVIGFVLIPFFILWEAKYARHPILPFPLMRDRGVWSALVIGVLVNFVWYMPNDFMYTVLVVGMRASVKAATRITSLYSFVSVIVGPLLGLVVVFCKRVKAFIVFGTACWFIALGMLMHFRGSNNGIESEKYLNGVIGSLCLMGFGAGFFTYATQVSIAACTNHEYMAVIISLYLSSYNIGSAFGASVSGAIWTNTIYEEISKNFRKAGLDESVALIAYLDPLGEFIKTYTWGTPERIAVVLAYAKVQRYLCITGLVLCVPLMCMALCLRDHKLEAVQSLELDHKDGVKSNDGTVIVNKNDEDIIITKIKQLFGKKN
jgi:SIT family siderophore-iron:H+ symporter-like MFS transporter